MSDRAESRLAAVYEPILRSFRTRRMAEFARALSPGPGTGILDVGGTPFNWTLLDCPADITLLNLRPIASDRLPSNITAAVGDDRLPYGGGEFDIVFSNSVIEHVGSFDDQKRCAAELSRAGRSLWVQTPARSFVIEPYLLTAFLREAGHCVASPT